jgi:RNA-directed DNA polymerase
MHIKKAIANDISIPENLIDDAISVARTQVKVFFIKKKSGGRREIFHPSKKLKTIQYWLIHCVFNKMSVHDASMAYREGISILHNAEKHRANRFFLKMDLKNFFPSVSFNDFIPILREWHKSEKPKWNLDLDAEELIKKACFYINDRLAIGYPCSPVISNIVMGDFDTKISTLISNEKYGKVIYTRYADDLVFSTDKKGACSKIKTELIALINSTTTPNISVNHNKTRLGSSTGGSASVTGLKICSGGHVTIPRKQKDHIRLLLSLYSKGTLEPEEEKSLLGHLSYCHYVAPDFYTKLSKKYFQEINVLLTKNL